MFFIFFEDEDNEAKNEIKTISYQLDADGKILRKWERNGTIKQLMGAINSVGEGRSEIISESDWKDLFSVAEFSKKCITK